MEHAEFLNKILKKSVGTIRLHSMLKSLILYDFLKIYETLFITFSMKVDCSCSVGDRRILFSYSL